MSLIPLMMLITLYIAFSFSSERYELTNTKATVASDNIKIYHMAAIDKVVESGITSGSIDDIFKSGPFNHSASFETEVFSSPDFTETVVVTYALPEYASSGADGQRTYDPSTLKAFSELSDIGVVNGYRSYAGTYVPNENMWFGGSVGNKTFSTIPINIPDNSPVLITYLGQVTGS